MRKRNRQLLLIGASSIVLLIGVILISKGMSHLRSGQDDTSEGLAIIQAEEDADIKKIEEKIDKLNTKEEKNTQNIKSRFSSVVVMGDSITEALVEYDILSPSSVVSEIGIRLDQVEDAIATAVGLQPKIIFLSYGMNDVLATQGDTEKFTRQYAEVVDSLKEQLPNTTIFVNSIFPVSKVKSEEEPLFQEIPKYNEALQEMCDKKNIAFVDNTILASEQYYEEDGVHFKANFYSLWIKRMAEVAAL